MAGQAFDVPRKSIFMFMPEDVIIVGLDDPYKDAPTNHDLYDNRKDMKLSKEFIDDLEMNGVIQTIEVTKLGDQAIVVDGRQRVKGLRRVNDRLRKKGVPETELFRVPAKFVKHAGGAEMLGRLISSNAHHHQDRIIEKAEKAARLLDLGRTNKEVATRNGVSAQTIANWMKVLECIPEVKRAVDYEQISASAAAELANLSPEEQKKALDEMLADGKTTTADAKDKAAKAKGGKASKKPGKKLARAIIEEHDSLIVERPIDAVKWAIGDLDPEEEWEELYEVIQEYE